MFNLFFLFFGIGAILGLAYVFLRFTIVVFSFIKHTVYPAKESFEEGRMQYRLTHPKARKKRR